MGEIMGLIQGLFGWLLGAIVSFCFAARQQVKAHALHRPSAETLARMPQVVRNIEVMLLQDAKIPSSLKRLLFIARLLRRKETNPNAGTFPGSRTPIPTSDAGQRNCYRTLPSRAYLGHPGYCIPQTVFPVLA